MSKHNDCNCHHEPEYRYYYFGGSDDNVRFTQRDGRILGTMLLTLAIALLLFVATR